MEKAWGRGGRAGDREELASAGGDGEDLEGEEEEELETPGAGRAEGGLEGVGSLPVLLQKEEGEEKGDEEGLR